MPRASLDRALRATNDPSGPVRIRQSGRHRVTVACSSPVAHRSHLIEKGAPFL